MQEESTSIDVFATKGAARTYLGVLHFRNELVGEKDVRTGGGDRIRPQGKSTLGTRAWPERVNTHALSSQERVRNNATVVDSSATKLTRKHSSRLPNSTPVVPKQ